MSARHSAAVFERYRDVSANGRIIASSQPAKPPSRASFLRGIAHADTEQRWSQP